LRRTQGLLPAPEFALWLEHMQITRDGQPSPELPAAFGQALARLAR
jgi:ethanolamine ammonia-lyase large subunit